MEELTTLMKRNSAISLIILGVVLGLFIFVSPATFMMSLIVFIITVALWNSNLPRAERDFLIKIFIVAVLIRVFICLLIYFISVSKGGEGSLFQDDVGQPRIAWFAYQWWIDKFNIEAYQDLYYNFGTGIPQINTKECYLIAISLLFSVINYFTPLVAKFINIILGSLLPLLIYDIVKEPLGEGIAKISTLLIVFFPSLILLSILALKDIPCIFLVTLAIWVYIKWHRKRKRYFLFPLLFATFALYSIRKDLSYLLVAVFIASYLINLKISWFNKIVFICLIWLCFSCILPYKFRDAVSNLARKFSINSLLKHHKGYVTSGGNVYKIMDEDMYALDEFSLNPLQVTSMTLKGIFYFMLVPFPWNARNLWQIASIPQMILWYFFLPGFLIGIFFVLRHKFSEFMPILLFLALAVFTISLYEGNIGTAARHRDLITPFYIVFSVIGLRQVYYFLGCKI